MRILLIGNFSPPYEEENLHNFTLLNHLKQEGNECRVLNISELSRDSAATTAKYKEIVNVKNYPDFIIKFLRYGFGCSVIHFLTKGYTRPGLMKLVTAIFFGRLLLARTIITLHSELFSIFGRLRSKMGGQQLLRLSFSLAHGIICGDKPTYEIARRHHKARDKFLIIPSFVQIPEDLKENESLFFRKLENKKKVIVFSNVRYPSLLFEILNNLLANYLDSDMAIVVSLSEKNSRKLQHVIEEVGSSELTCSKAQFQAGKLSDNIIFIESADMRQLLAAYARSDLVLRTLSCDGKTLFEDIALSLKKPVRSGNYLHFPLSLSLIKEGEVADLCAHVFNLLVEKTGELLEPVKEDFYAKIKKIYLKNKS